MCPSSPSSADRPQDGPAGCTDTACSTEPNGHFQQLAVEPAEHSQFQQLADEPSKQYQLIQKIRRKYNQEAAEGRSAEDEEAIRELVTTVAAEAKLLSTELYTKPTHFVLELLQNADDCSYAAGVQPRVLLVVMHDAILHATNEIGFKAAEVEAICAMARSTKSRKVGAFTGEKGIGFKATAVASEVTYISSSGYTFSFDMRPEAYSVPCLGLVCPRWEEGLQQHMKDWLNHRLAGSAVCADILDEFNTCMWMQLKPDLDRQKLMQELCLLDPYMLLNLRQLKDVALLLVQQGDVQLKHLRRADVDAAHISIGMQQGAWGGPLQTVTRHLLCMRHILQVPAEIAAGEEKRQGVEEVEVVFALPVNEDGTPSPDPHAQVFAFLPVKAYGFRFHMQADLVLPSSRESILESRPWNRWLQQELSATFLALAMQAVQAHQQQQQQALLGGGSQQPALSPAALLQYLPLPGDVADDFMGQVSTAILEGLSTEPCVLTASGKLSTPDRTLLPEPLLVVTHGGKQQQLISNEWLQHGLPNAEFVSDTVPFGPEAERNARVLLQLGSRRFSAQLLLSWLCADGTAHLLRSLTPEQRCEWLPALYSCCMALRAQPAGSLMHLAADMTTQAAMRRAPILQLYGSKECVSLQELQDSGRQVYLWDSSFGDEADLQLISQGPCDAPQLGSTTGSTCSSHSSSRGLSGSSTPAGLCFLDPSTLGPDGAAFVGFHLLLRKVPLKVLMARILQMQAGGELSDAQHDQLLLFLLRNAASLSSHDLQLLRDQLMLRSAAIAAAGNASGCSNGMYVQAKQLHLPLHATSMPSVSQAVLHDPALQHDLTAAGLAFASEQYAKLDEQLSLGTGRQGIWQLLRSFGLQELTLATAVQQLLQLYYTDSTGAARQPVQPLDHQRHLQFLSEAVRDPVCLQHIKQGLKLYNIRQDPAAAVPAFTPGELFWPMEGTVGANAITDQLSMLCGVQLVHPAYVLVESAGNSLVKSITTTLTPAEVWRQLVQLHSKQDLQAAASTLGLSLQDLLLQQLTYLAGVRLKLQDVASAQQHRTSTGKRNNSTTGSFHIGSTSNSTSGNRASGSADAQLPGLLLLNSQGQLQPSSQLHLPPHDPAVLELLRDLQEAGCGLQLLHPCFQAFWQDAISEQCLLLTTTLGVRRADRAAVMGAIVKLHRQQSAQLSEEQRMQHLAYLAQHISFLQQPQHCALLHQVQEAVLLLDARGQYSQAQNLHMPLGQQYSALEADMCAAGMLFLHSSYTATQLGAVDASSSVQGTMAGKQLHDLLSVLGVRQSDANSIAQYIMKLYGSKDAVRPSAEQHLSHLAFLRQRWADLTAKVQDLVFEDLSLVIADTVAVRAHSCADADRPAAGGDDSSAGIEYTRSTVHILPAPTSAMTPLLHAMALGGARFLHPMYEHSGGEELVSWLQARKLVHVLTNAQAAKFLLDAHTKRTAASWHQQFTTAEMAQQALFVALWGDTDTKSSAKCKLLLAVHATCPPDCKRPPRVLYRTSAGQEPIYFPATGEDWALQEILLPGQVVYLHSEYVKLLSQLHKEHSSAHDMLRGFLAMQLGVQMRPIPGSGPLKQALKQGRWRPFLLMLADEWRQYGPSQQQQLAARLKDLTVETSCGPRLLQQCFLSRSSIPGLVLLMSQLQLPFLQLPDADSGRWEFLQSCGVSMELTWPTLLKVLQQLSSSGAKPPLASMQQLYNSIAALEALTRVRADELRTAFGQHPLLFVPGTGHSAGSWHRISEVVWLPDDTVIKKTSYHIKANRLFPQLAFIGEAYQDWKTFFCNTLQVRNAGLEDLKASLLHFSSTSAERYVDHVCSIYELLAQHAAELTWLPGLFSSKPVLLIQQGSRLSFTSTSSNTGMAPIYLPDNAKLLGLFREDVRVLAVPPEKVPALQPLLSCIRPQLPPLGASVQRSFEASEGTPGASRLGRQQDGHWAQQLQQALPLFARYLYYKHHKVFSALFEGGHLLQLSNMPVFRMTGLVQTLQLGCVKKTIPTQAAVQMLTAEQLAQWLNQQQQQQQQQRQGAMQGDGDKGNSSTQPVLLIDAHACPKPAELRNHVVDPYVDLLLLLARNSSSSSTGDSTSSSITAATGYSTSAVASFIPQQGHAASIPAVGSPAAADMVRQLRTILKDVARGDIKSAVSELVHDGIDAIPAEYDPWQEAEATAAAAGGVSEGSSDEEAGEEDEVLPQQWHFPPAAAAAGTGAGLTWPGQAAAAPAPALSAAAAAAAAAAGSVGTATAGSADREPPIAQPEGDSFSNDMQQLANLMERSLSISGSRAADQAAATAGAASQQAPAATGSTLPMFVFGASAHRTGHWHAPRHSNAGAGSTGLGNAAQAAAGPVSMSGGPGASAVPSFFAEQAPVFGSGSGHTQQQQQQDTQLQEDGHQQQQQQQGGDAEEPGATAGAASQQAPAATGSTLPTFVFGASAHRTGHWHAPRHSNAGAGSTGLGNAAQAAAGPVSMSGGPGASAVPSFFAEQAPVFGSGSGHTQQQQQQQDTQRPEDGHQQQQQQGGDATIDAAEEPVPQDAQHSWLAGAIKAAHAAAASGRGLVEACRVSQQQQQAPSSRCHSMVLPSLQSFIVTPLSGSSSQCATSAGIRSATPAAAAAGSSSGVTAAAAARQVEVSAGSLFGSAAASARGDTEAAAGASMQQDQSDCQPGSSTASAGVGSFNNDNSFSAPNWNGDRHVDVYGFYDDYVSHLKSIGDVGEVFVYETLKQELPDFTGDCWHSGSRQLVGLPGLTDPSAEPAYDFLYTDSTGTLSGRPAGVPTMCFVEVKATRVDLGSSRGEPKPFEISRRQWELARALHANPEQGVFVIVRVERVGWAEGPRIAAVLRDPVQLLMDGQLWVTPQEKLLIEGYPVMH